MNETLKTISERYSCRAYKDEAVSDEYLQHIAKAAVSAPSSINMQPWRIIVVKNKQLIKEMEKAGMQSLGAMEDKSFFNRIIERGGDLFYNAPAMIVVAIDESQARANLDCGIVCQNITLAATSLGLGSVICGLAEFAFAGSKAEEFEKALGFPAGYKLGMTVLLGHPNMEGTPHTPDISKISFVG